MCAATAAFLEEHRGGADGFSLGDLLIQPIQRVPRYRMLLEELVKHTPLDHCDYGKCQAALAQIVHVASELNEAKRDAENKVRTLEVRGVRPGWSGLSR